VPTVHASQPLRNDNGRFAVVRTNCFLGLAWCHHHWFRFFFPFLLMDPMATIDLDVLRKQIPSEYYRILSYFQKWISHQHGSQTTTKTKHDDMPTLTPNTKSQRPNNLTMTTAGCIHTTMIMLTPIRSWENGGQDHGSDPQVLSNFSTAMNGQLTTLRFVRFHSFILMDPITCSY